jgi:hypothetical protein
MGEFFRRCGIGILTIISSPLWALYYVLYIVFGLFILLMAPIRLLIGAFTKNSWSIKSEYDLKAEAILKAGQPNSAYPADGNPNATIPGYMFNSSPTTSFTLNNQQVPYQNPQANISNQNNPYPNPSYDYQNNFYPDQQNNYPSDIYPANSGYSPNQYQANQSQPNPVNPNYSSQQATPSYSNIPNIGNQGQVQNSPAQPGQNPSNPYPYMNNGQGGSQQ